MFDTYDLLKWLSEVGGLYKSISLIFGVIIGLLLSREEKNIMASVDPDYREKLSVESLIDIHDKVNSREAKIAFVEYSEISTGD